MAITAVPKNHAVAGLTELKLQGVQTVHDGRLWRTVPNRKWYADQRGSRGAGKEVVLFHKVTV